MLDRQRQELAQLHADSVLHEEQYCRRVMQTTGYHFEGYRIKEYIKVISAEVVMGTGFLPEVSASFSDFFGNTSLSFEQKIESVRDAVTEKLVLKALKENTNAIIGIDYDYAMFNANMIGVIASGTCVTLEPLEN